MLIIFSRKFFIFISLLLSSFLFGSFLAHAQATIFSESFDSLSEMSANGATYSGVTIEPGKSGNGVYMEGTDSLSYPTPSNFNFRKGTIEFWVKPKWDGATATGKAFLNIKWGATQGLNIMTYSYADSSGNVYKNLLLVQFNDRDTYNRRNFDEDIMDWKSDTWHKVIIYWDFTLADNSDGTHNSYLVYRLDDKFADNFVSVAPVDSEAMASGAKMTFGQDTVPGRNPVNAVLDEFKIYDTSLLPVVPYPAYKFRPRDPSTVTTFYQLFANDGFCSPFENYNNAPADCSKLSDGIKSGQNVLFFQKPLLEQVYENTIPKEEEIKDTMDYQAAQGQFEDLFFNAYSRINLNNVKVSTTDFTGSAGTISKSNLDLRVVKNWFQAAHDQVDANPLPNYVPELLLYNDQVSYDTDPTLVNSYTVPSIPKLDHVKTKIDNFNSKQFVLIAKVPDDTPAGTYTATVTLTADGVPAQTLTLRLEVLPFVLRDTTRKLVVGGGPSSWYFMGTTLDDLYNFGKPYFQDSKDHGSNSAGVGVGDNNIMGSIKGSGSGLDVLKIGLKTMQELGFKYSILGGFNDPDIYANLTSTYTDAMRQYGFEPWFYGVDEFGDYTRNGESHTVLWDHVAKSIIVHNIGGKMVDTSGKGDADRIANPNDPIYQQFPAGTYEPEEWGVYPSIESYFPDLMAGRVQKTANRLESFYWQGSDEDPWHNRYYIGYFLWNTGMDGAWPWGYLYTSATWYDDFNWTHAVADHCCRCNTQIYPSKEGPVPTMEWEALREGINDLKYLETWKYYKDMVAKTNSSLAQDSEKTVNNILDRYKNTYYTARPAGSRVSMAQYEADRKTIISEVLKLKQSANPSNADLNSDNFVNQTDFDILKADFLKLAGSLANPKSDIDGDGTVTIKDVGIMMSEWKP